jgi:ankyrin repeat protein
MMARSEATSWLLAKGGADNEVLDRRDNHGDTALLHAVLAGDLISCRYLLRAALPVVGGSAIATAEAVAVVRKRNVNNDGCTLLHCAAMAGHANLLRWLFDTCLCHDLVQTLDQAGDSPLRLAAHWGHLDCAQLLVTFGAVEGLHGRADRALFERDVTELPVRSALLKWGGDAANELRGFQRNFLAGCLKKASPHLTMLRKPAKQHRDRPRIIIAEYAGIPFGSSARRARELGGLFGVSH